MKKILITGATGFLGKNLAFFLKSKKNYKIILSGRSIERCRLAGQELKLKYYPCEISNLNSVIDCISKIRPDIIIHSAATKYVDIAEKLPFECIDTNIVGTLNLIRVSKKFNVKSFIAISTDKAAPPFNNIYSLSKSVMEKSIMLDSIDSKMKVVCLRFGNLPWSTGSIFPIWLSMTEKDNMVKSTGPEMTRFFYTVDDACQLINHTINNLKSFNSKIIIPKMKSAKIKDLLSAWCKIYNTKWKKVKSRQGDKNYESIISSFEYGNIKYKKFKAGKIILLDTFKEKHKKDFNSNNSEKFTEKEIKNLILKKPKFL